jgi:hypothetical protein
MPAAASCRTPKPSDREENTMKTKSHAKAGGRRLP